ncbi:MAG: hypothetical protein ACH344_10485 [Yersinia sp. (in: enterobacteria)]
MKKTFFFEEYLTDHCWKRDQSNTLPIDRKAIPTIVTPIYPFYPTLICYNSHFVVLRSALFGLLSH